MAPRRGRESSTGLVIALVFAVLLVIGLGVTAYMQANAKDAERKRADAAVVDKEKMTKARDWYKFQSMYYRACMGQTEGIDFADLGALKTQFDGGSLGADEKDKEGVTKLVKETLDRRLPWDPAQNKPRQSYEALLATEKGQREAAVGQAEAAKEAQKVAEVAQKKANDDLKAERNTFEAKLAELNQKTQVDMSGYLKDIGDLRKEIARLGEKSETIVKAATDKEKQLDEALAKSGKKISDLSQQVETKKQKLEEVQNKGVGVAPKDWQTDWKIVSIDRTGDMPFINLGSSDHVQPQLTFSIHGTGPGGKPLPQSKGSLEVVNVLGPHLSQTRVLTVRDGRKDPILRGDVLYNPSWSPTLKKHVALAGIMDLTGDGRDATYELIRNLERQNIVVDAYVDRRDGAIKGKGITSQTDFLILGSAPKETPGEGRDPQKEADRKYEEEVGKLRKQAKESGVQEEDLKKYLEMIGYRLPRTALESGATFAPGAGTAPAPAEPAVAPKKGDDKKPDDKPPPDDKPGEDKPK